MEQVPQGFCCTAKSENPCSTMMNVILCTFVNLCSGNLRSIYYVLGILGASVRKEIKSSLDHLRPCGYLGRECVGVGKRREGKIGEERRESYTRKNKRTQSDNCFTR